MRKMHIGKVIRQRREALGYTQQELCEGICEPPNISRIENGVQIPSRSTMSLILERLGLPGDMYVAYLSDNEAEIEDLQTEIVSCNMTVKSEQGLDAIDRLESIIKDNDKIIKQFILRSNAILGHRVNGKIVPYSKEERLELLLKAIRLTVPRFELQRISDHLYGIIEVKIINQIAQVYSEQGECEKAIEIYRQLLPYVLDHMQGLKEQSAIIPMLAYNYSRELCLAQRVQEALEIAEQGKEYSVRYYQYSDLGGLLVIIADCLSKLGYIEKSKEAFIESYYLYKITGNIDNAKIVQQHAKETLSIDIP